MLNSITGKDKAYFDMFEKAAVNTAKTAEHLHVYYAKFPDSSEEVARIKDLEHAGDMLTHETIEMLNRSFVTPIDREDIYLLITKMDDILDLMDGAANRTELYKIDKITPEALELAEILKKAANILHHTIISMRNLKDYQEIIKHCIEIHTIENEGDQLFRKAMVNLFEQEKNDPIKVIKWKEIYEDLETATDKCEDVANIIESIAMKYS
ncbi:MAG: DUF47 domain-containing protein [Elusimicrobia bacterium]|nr:DUF47 domain-containing protein [Elusimicrobiota bacterium]